VCYFTYLCYFKTYGAEKMRSTFSGPSAWPGICQTGQSQTPINIVTAAATPVVLGDIRFTPAYWHKIEGTYLNDGDTGITWMINQGSISSTYIFYLRRSHKQKRQSSHQYLFALFGSVGTNAACKMLVK